MSLVCRFLPPGLAAIEGLDSPGAKVKPGKRPFSSARLGSVCAAPMQWLRPLSCMDSLPDATRRPKTGKAEKRLLRRVVCAGNHAAPVWPVPPDPPFLRQADFASVSAALCTNPKPPLQMRKGEPPGTYARRFSLSPRSGTLCRSRVGGNLMLSVPLSSLRSTRCNKQGDPRAV